MRELHFVLICIVVSMGLLGCARSESSQFYLLSLRAPQRVEQGSPTCDSIGIEVATFPEYLDRPEFVTRSGAHELVVHEFARWGERLRTNFERELAQGVSQMTGVGDVRVYPWKPIGFEPSVRLVVEVERFECSSTECRLSARWRSNRGKEETPVRIFGESRGLSSPAASDLTGALSDLLGAFAATVADVCAAF